MLTNQQIFDKVLAHAQAQYKEYGDDAQSLETDATCLYRQKISDGRVKMCFIGLFIPNEKYDSIIEGESVQGLFDKHGDMMLAAGLDQSQSSFLQALQHIHDENCPSKWDSKFAVFAVSFDLECSIESVL